jgi:hypothetical protein
MGATAHSSRLALFALLIGCGRPPAIGQSNSALEMCEFPNLEFGIPAPLACDVGATTAVSGKTVEGCSLVNGVLLCPIQAYDAAGNLIAQNTIACSSGPAFDAIVAHEATQDTVSFCCQKNPSAPTSEGRDHGHFARKACSWIRCKDYDPVKYANTAGFYTSCGCTNNDIINCKPCLTADATARADGGCGLSTGEGVCSNDSSSTLTTICHAFCQSPPAITIAGDSPLSWECGSGAYADPGATAADGCGYGLPMKLTSEASAVDTGTVGAYSVTYTATPEQGYLVTTAIRAVNVVDTQAPLFDPASAQTLVGNCSGDPVAFTVPTATDQCSAVSVSCATLAGNRFGANPVSCTATDATGNQASVDIMVNLIEPLRIALYPPLSVDAPTVAKAGSTLVCKAKLFNCQGQDVTATAATSARLQLALASGGPIQTSFNGVGAADEEMVQVADLELGPVYQYNLSTRGLVTGGHYTASVSASYTDQQSFPFSSPVAAIDTH